MGWKEDHPIRHNLPGVRARGRVCEGEDMSADPLDISRDAAVDSMILAAEQRAEELAAKVRANLGERLAIVPGWDQAKIELEHASFQKWLGLIQQIEIFNPIDESSAWLGWSGRLHKIEKDGPVKPEELHAARVAGIRDAVQFLVNHGWNQDFCQMLRDFADQGEAQI